MNAKRIVGKNLGALRETVNFGLAPILKPYKQVSFGNIVNVSNLKVKFFEELHFIRLLKDQ